MSSPNYPNVTLNLSANLDNLAYDLTQSLEDEEILELILTIDSAVMDLEFSQRLVACLQEAIDASM